MPPPNRHQLTNDLPEGKPSGEEVQRLQHRPVARVVPQRRQIVVVAGVDETDIALAVRTLEPRERRIALAAPRIDLGDLVRERHSVLANQLLEQRLRGGSVTERVLRHRAADQLPGAGDLAELDERVRGAAFGERYLPGD